MRNVLVVAIAVVGLLAAPSLGVVNVRLMGVVDGGPAGSSIVLTPGQSATILVQGQGTTAGLVSLGGKITADSSSGSLVSSGFAWQPSFAGQGELYGPNMQAVVSTSLPDGGWGGSSNLYDNSGNLLDSNVIGFGSSQPWVVGVGPDLNYGRTDFATLATYTITANVVPGAQVVHLSFSPLWVHGYRPLECDKTGIYGTSYGLQVTVIPDPATLALMTLGGLLALRRRLA